MAMSLQEQLRAKRAETERWIREREAQLRRTAAAAEAKGRQIYANAIKTGEKVLARTPAEIRALGEAVIQRRPSREVAPSTTQTARSQHKGARPQPPPSPAPEKSKADALVKVLSGAADTIAKQGGSALSGAVDEVSFGLADRATAFAHAALKGSDYETELAQEKQKDARDAEKYGIARAGGQIAGFAATLVGTGGVGAGVKAGVKVGAKAVGMLPALQKATRAANATRRIKTLTPGGLNTMAAAGGATAGVLGQSVSDALRGELGSVGDYAGAALGGATGALSMRLPGLGKSKTAQRLHHALTSPALAGGVEGAATYSLQGVLNGEDASLRGVAEAARGGLVGAQIGDVAGKYGANAMTNKGKEWVGENLSVVKSLASGDGTPWGRPVANFDELVPGAMDYGATKAGPGMQKYIALKGAPKTRADHITNKGMAVESKMGAYAGLTDAQKVAFRELGPTGRYRVDHWLPSDVGRMGSVALGAPMSHAPNERR